MTFVAHYREGRLSRLVLGTAQLGFSYGIANRGGKPDPATVTRVLDAAANRGIAVLDTAPSYGDSEAALGAYRTAHPARPFLIVTKLPPETDVRSRAAVLEAVQRSKTRLGGAFSGMLLHDPSHMDSWEGGLGRALGECLDRGDFECAGVSVYTPEEFARALRIEQIQIIQAPFNVLDRRLYTSGLLSRAERAGRIVFLRSVYLQGLLLMDPASLPSRMRFARPALQRWHALCNELGLGPAAAALKYAREVSGRSLLIVGCETPKQVEANANLFERNGLPKAAIEAINALPLGEDRVIDPRLWPKEQ